MPFYVVDHFFETDWFPTNFGSFPGPYSFSKSPIEGFSFVP